MTKRQEITPAPGPLETFAQEFDALFSKVNQRIAFRRYLEGLLLPTERNKTLTALANAEPIVGAQEPAVQALQWFLSESKWDEQAVSQKRVELLRSHPATAPDAAGVLVIDETGDRKWGNKTAHVGRQYLGSIGKIDNGVVSVTSLWADAQVYYPLAVEPFTPKQHFPKGMADPDYRTKPRIALELVKQAVTEEIPFRAVVADSFYGENEGFRNGVARLGLGYVLALKTSHSWWGLVGTVNSLEEAARAATWAGPDAPGDWQPVARTFRDGHTETWWALEITVGPYGPTKPQRAVVVTLDPTTLPELNTWHLVTNLPASVDTDQSGGKLAPADLAEIVRLYGLRNWVEQSYKQVKGTLGWNAYQVRKDRAIRRHWALVCCAFSFCWWAESRDRPKAVIESVSLPAPTDAERSAPAEKKSAPRLTRPADPPPPRLLAAGASPDPGLARTLDHARTLLARVVERAPAPTPPRLAPLARTRPSHRSL